MFKPFPFFLSLLFCFFFSVALTGQSDSIYNDDPTQYLPVGMDVAEYKHLSAKGGIVDEVRVHPPFWWTGMAEQTLEILIYDEKINGFDVRLQAPDGIELTKVYRVENPNYLFVEIEIGPGTNACTFDILLSKGDETRKYPYQLKTREKRSNNIQGLTSSDLIYLIMPDRFANGDYTNDSFDDMLQAGINRDKMYFRHGGDLQGIIDNLDYLEELGVTALWLNPVMENDQPYASYHGYAVTDHYEIDKRFGSNEEYKNFVQKCHERGIKVIMDIIFNHCGHEHWLMKDIPEEDWVHQWQEFTRSNFRSSIISDPYAAEADSKQLLDGWFDYSMPDLNQKNQRLAKYLIQNTIWWVEYSGQDAYRIDTWYFPDQDFLSQWAKRMQQEFPTLGLFGETWAQMQAVQATFAENSGLTGEYNSHLPSITDFQLNFAIEAALTKEQSWTDGVAKIYYTLAQDFLYENPYRNVIFLDNHDKSRFLSVVGENVDKLKSGITILLTMRGIPSLYYGTELLFSGVADPDGLVRQDFPGGWQEDKINKFKTSGRTSAENDMFEYVKKLANYRKNTPALHSGQLTHFTPVDGIYVYFRYNTEKTIMVIVNTNAADKTLKTDRFSERAAGFSHAKNIITEKVINDLEEIDIPGNTTVVLELISP